MKGPVILVVEDNEITRKVIRLTLEGEGYAVVEAPDGATALAAVREQSPDLIIQDLRLPDIDGIELAARLRALPGTAGVPILACSGFLSKMEEARTANAGFTDYLFKPVEPSLLRQIVGAHLPLALEPQGRPGRGKRVLVADDDPMMRKVVALHLERLGFSVTQAADGEEALERARAGPPDAIVTDVLMPRLDGFRLCLAVRQDPRLARIPVVLASAAFVDEEDRALARRVGANAFVVRTPDFAEGLEALLASLREPPPAMPVGPVDVLAEEYSHRMVRQLERQIGLNQELVRRLGESEEHTRLIVSHALDAVVTIDADGRITSWNPQAERLFGWSPEEILGRLLSETIIPPAYREAHERGLAHFRATGEGPVLNRRIELTALRRDGTEFPVELAITSLRVGGAVAFSAFLRDITDRKRSEQALRDSEASFRLLFADNPLPMWVYDVATMYFLEVNAAAIQHYGYSREEFLRMRITEIRPPEDVPRLKDVVAGFTAASDQAVRRHAGTWRHRLKDGRIRDVDIVSHSMEFAGRRATLVVAIDVTELKQTEASLAKSTERLKILHEIDRALIATEAPVAIAEGVLPLLRDLLGVPRVIVNLFDLAAGQAEWLAAAGRRRVRVGPGVRFPLALMGDVEALRRGELQVIDVNALPRSPEAEALLASGVHTYMVVPMIAGGELIGGLSFGGASAEFPPEQVSIAREAATQLAIALEQARLRERVKRHTEELEQRVAERTLELSAANAQLQQEIAERRRAEADAARANHAKSEFLSRMSHELRTPLNAILGFAQLLELDAKRAEDRESVAQIMRGGRHLLGLINEVLDIARIEAGELALSLEPVRVGDAVQQVLDLARPLATARGIDLESAGLALHARHVWADSLRLQQVLLNLVSNGIKYNRERGKLTLACDAGDERRLRISVRDTGPGIAPALRERLFQPFDRLGAEQGGVEGTGLGLVLSKRLVEAMGGTLGVESVQDEGSTFWVELLETESPAERQEPSEPDAAAPATLSKSGTVLYIEDNLSNLRLVERAIARHHGVKLIPAMQGRLGLELARQHRPDLILLDLHLPDVPGEQVLRELHADPQLRRTPVIVLSADATPGQVERLVAIGARAYLTKPLDVRRFLDLVDEALPSREATDG